MLQEGRKGLQAADWHEGPTRHRAALAEELKHIAADARAARVLDIARLQRLLAQWPADGWERSEINQLYRGVLLRGLSAGYFLRHGTGSP